MAIKSSNGPSNAGVEHEEGIASGPAPPSYAAVTAGQPSLPAPNSDPTYPQIVPYPTTHNSLRTPGALEQGIYDAQSHPFANGNEAQNGWTPPQTEQEARARTRKRFLVACLWGFGIYMLIGLLLGGGFEDSSTTSRRDRNRHRQPNPVSDRPSNPGERVDPAHPSRTWKHVDRTSTVSDVVEPTGITRADAGTLVDMTELREDESTVEELDLQQVRGILEAIENARY